MLPRLREETRDRTESYHRLSTVKFGQKFTLKELLLPNVKAIPASCLW